jgi:hypothetical protein
VDNLSKAQDDDDFFLFKRAILIEGFDQTLAPTDQLLTSIAAVVTYNLGLAHHLLGLQNGNYQRKNYAKALRFYELADTLNTKYSDNCGSYFSLLPRSYTPHSFNNGNIFLWDESRLETSSKREDERRVPILHEYDVLRQMTVAPAAERRYLNER